MRVEEAVELVNEFQIAVTRYREEYRKTGNARGVREASEALHESTRKVLEALSGREPTRGEIDAALGPAGRVQATGVT